MGSPAEVKRKALIYQILEKIRIGIDQLDLTDEDKDNLFKLITKILLQVKLNIDQFKERSMMDFKF